MLVRDKGGAIFGGFASAPWQRHGDFYGAEVGCHRPA